MVDDLMHKETKIRLTEDRLLRTRDANEQAAIQALLAKMRIEYSRMKWERAQ